MDYYYFHSFTDLVRAIKLRGARGGVVVKALSYKRHIAGSIPDGVNGIFQ